MQSFSEVSTGYFQAAGTTLLSGRPVTLHDDQNSPHAAVVNQAFVRRVFGFPTGAIGRCYKTRNGTRIQVFLAEEKIRIVMEGIRAEMSVADLCRREGIHPTIYYRGLKDFMEAN